MLRCAILQSLAPPEAIVLVRSRNNYHESEVVIDPLRLGKVKVLGGRKRPPRLVPTPRSTTTDFVGR